MTMTTTQKYHIVTFHVMIVCNVKKFQCFGTACICTAVVIRVGMWWSYVGGLSKSVLTILTFALKMEADSFCYPQTRLHGVTAHKTIVWMLIILKLVCWHQSAMKGCGAQRAASSVSVKMGPLVTVWLANASVLRVGEEPGKSCVPRM